MNDMPLITLAAQSHGEKCTKMLHFYFQNRLLNVIRDMTVINTNAKVHFQISL